MSDKSFGRRQFSAGAALSAAALVVSACATDTNPTSNNSSTPEVRTTEGTVRGKLENNIAVFRGIPYAEAPVGTLRLQAPVRHTPWSGVREAFDFGPQPPQAVMPGTTANTANDSNEWLTVNVWSPDVKASGLPVMVWIYGGGFMMGSSAMPSYNGANLATKGVVVVSLNYRVSMEGYGLITGAPANRGLLDQIAALSWVRDNIAAFGGDPGRVTIFGQSAGAGSTAMLLAAPAARGLFQRAIAQSVPTALQTPELAADVATVVAARVGKQPTVADLTALDPQTLADAAAAVSKNIAQYQDRWGYGLVVAGPEFGPVIDPDSLPEGPYPALARGVSKDVTLMVGHTKDEYNFMIAMAGGPDKITTEQIDKALRLLPPVPDGPQAYRAAYPEADDKQLYQIVCSDFLFRMPSLRLAQAHTAGGGRSYLYEFRYDKTPIGAAHGNEIPLVFGLIDTEGTRTYGNPPAADAVTLGQQMQADWLAFATTGDPGWPAYRPDTQQARSFDASSTTGPYLELASEQIWANDPLDPLPLRHS
ncbi:carboxylesterase family protein [Nocardia sp. NPDC051756]|uniref:carboxylesterase/lipase family protein n=1 Tax=Nocardia sp. NPDC051756 TaxID=3154751 RepID=UPI00344872FA